ncbi:MAG: hypothetical protein REI96_07725 [Flavobacterium nitrogenifigens]|uniref:Uncharacterized protein n=1 Tax=Flavobacterium nitrogenifigens TaxID=1617283 RepID=A0A521EG56_9FLAO|nr:hypothetical protein [Flavobacterium nitrogenifigens]KAF2326041.1 hypothetical protein DM397_22570 [Flavobacterium nitrogenifigens]MDQ8012319.1 hypothetical protein [Flavobacterium nitrogenifigens]SMO82868.1 hypothetical protein SAMN06265220_104251 [Flavobacterium nitrogenifigens]
MKKLNIAALFIQFLGMIFFINGIFQLRLYTVADKIILIRNQFHFQKQKNWNKLFPTNEDVLNFWPSVYIWIFFALLIGVLYIAYLNWKSKLSSINTILLAIALYVLLRLKFFRKEIFSAFFRPIRVLLSDDLATQCLIEGVIFTVIGVSIIYLSANSKLFTLSGETIES